MGIPYNELMRVFDGSRIPVLILVDTNEYQKRTKKMKTITLLIAKIVTSAAASLSLVWAVIEFILYLVKDKPFNWWSVWVFFTSVALAITSFLLLIFVVAKDKRKEFNTHLDNLQERPKSKFRQRLDEAMAKNNS